jgi:hypothetical protein
MRSSPKAPAAASSATATTATWRSRRRSRRSWVAGSLSSSPSSLLPLHVVLPLLSLLLLLLVGCLPGLDAFTCRTASPRAFLPSPAAAWTSRRRTVAVEGFAARTTRTLTKMKGKPPSCSSPERKQEPASRPTSITPASPLPSTPQSEKHTRRPPSTANAAARRQVVVGAGSTLLFALGLLSDTKRGGKEGRSFVASAAEAVLEEEGAVLTYPGKTVVFKVRLE